MMNMKKLLFTMTVLLTLSIGLQAAAQKHRHSPRTALVDTTSTGGVDVYSDTTSTDTATVTKHSRKVTITTPTSPWSSRTTTYEMDDDDFGRLFSNVFDSMGANGIAGMFFVLCVLLIIFVLAPVLIIVALFYFINKNRKEKMRLAQMAMQQGQPIPDQLLNNDPISDTDEYQKGMRQCFVGIGLMIFLGYAAGHVGFGIGALVFCIGLGKVFASKTSQRRNNNNNDLLNNDQL